MHKNTRLLPYMRRAIYDSWRNQKQTIAMLSREYRVSRVTIYKVLERARLKEYENRKSINKRFRTLEYGLRKLSKTEKYIQKRLDRLSIKRYEKEYPGEMSHFDTKRLPLLWGEAKTDKREHLHVAIDDYSRHLIADILPDKGQYSGAIHLQEVIDTAPYTIEKAYSDNGSTYKGRDDHAFVAKCMKNGIDRGYTKPYTPRTNGKAERVIRTLMEEWHLKGVFKNREERRQSLQEYVAYYNYQRTHTALNNRTPLQRIADYYSDACVNNA